MVTDLEPNYALDAEQRQADDDTDARLAPCWCADCCAGVGA